MNTSEKDQLRRWLEAEKVDAPTAEEALSAVFRILPRAEPPAGFAARVALRLGPRISEAVQPGVRLKALAGLTSLLGLVVCLGVMPWLVGPAVAAWASDPSLLTWLAEGVARASQMLVALLVGLGRGFDLARDFAAAAARDPGLALTMLLVMALAALAFWALARTLARERTVPHAVV